jgi:hypothetical protein
MKVYREYDVKLYCDYNHIPENDFRLIAVNDVQDNLLNGIFRCSGYHYKGTYRDDNGREKQLSGILDIKISAKVGLDYKSVIHFNLVSCRIINLNLNIDEMHEKIVKHIERRFDSHEKFSEPLQASYVLKDFCAK